MNLLHELIATCSPLLLLRNNDDDPCMPSGITALSGSALDGKRWGFASYVASADTSARELHEWVDIEQWFMCPHSPDLDPSSLLGLDHYRRFDQVRNVMSSNDLGFILDSYVDGCEWFLILRDE